jgi:3-phenylpropionate/trans-cinnamate dioxygenase ferredoxin subunit
MHEGRFDLRTGAATHEPAEQAIATYPLHIDGDDVFVEVPDE